MRTSSLLSKRPLNPREPIAHLFSSMRATSRPGTSRSASGMLVAPERRMSSCVIFVITQEDIRFGDAGGSRTPNVLLCDHENRGGGVGYLLRALGDGRHLHVHQIFHAHRRDVWNGFLVLGYRVTRKQRGKECS